ncbi:hypothetical protein I6E72_18600 [Pseudoalteromonas sp. NSLLW24]|jgi:hypothetical protein|uniref:hypothetical protein n=1 Tax=Pseudoalteromonas sp. NSLLW24 TaxID=2792050 RepID=UPI0018CF8C38|nr:hypothetical protein [Pseudoalteromonas sp. NSLLW24]MBH0000962.1 hypothetical protein [Pseudoalteromonas sp. NSLLW24]
MDEFSKEIELKFNSRFPKWKKFGRPTEYEGVTVFEAKVPCPSGKAEELLILDTFNEEVTVSFDAYHAHFDDFGNNDAYDEALEFILQVTSEEWAIVSYWLDERWNGSSLLKVTELPHDNSDYPAANIIKVKSWLGNFDKEIRFSAKS